MLNFGAVSWEAHVYVNGRLAGTHRGDYDSFSLDITRFLHRRGPNQLVVGFFDPIGGADEPVGKQVPGTPSGIYHTASSGIWQTVWLEPVASKHISALDLTPELRCRSSDRDGVGHERVRDDRGRPGAGWRPRGRHRQRPSRTAVCAADPRSTTVVAL